MLVVSTMLATACTSPWFQFGGTSSHSNDDTAETDLTLSDLRLVAEAFHRVLANIFHQRIDYPGFDFNAAPKREKRAMRQAS